MILNYDPNNTPALVDTSACTIEFDKFCWSDPFDTTPVQSSLISGYMEEAHSVSLYAASAQDDCYTSHDEDSVQEGGLSLGPYDIICGRDSDSFNHIGNRRFRVTVSLNVPQYQAVTSRQKRSELISSIIAVLKRDAGARFLKKKGAKYVELNEREMRQKVVHALRDAAQASEQRASKATEAKDSQKKGVLPNTVSEKLEPIDLDLPVISWQDAFLNFP